MVKMILDVVTQEQFLDEMEKNNKKEDQEADNDRDM